MYVLFKPKKYLRTTINIKPWALITIIPGLESIPDFMALINMLHRKKSKTKWNHDDYFI